MVGEIIRYKFLNGRESAHGNMKWRKNKWYKIKGKLENGTGCEGCGMEYSFFFGVQYHKENCPTLKNVRIDRGLEHD